MIQLSKKILVAEDDRGLSYSLDTWLTLEGFEVITVYNGDEALNAIKRNHYDLLITDIAMPRVNGVELITEIRKINPDLPILVVSGKLTPELQFTLESLKIQKILHKPIRPEQFRQTIQELFPGINSL
jgi:DNA-binding response OmpR family regulator